MRRTYCRSVSFVLDKPVKQLLSTARRVEHGHTTKMQERRSTTNSYHKEQYISAFLEAQSAATVHRHAVEATPTAQTALTTGAAHRSISQDLTALVHELETRYGEPTALSTSSSAATRHGDGEVVASVSSLVRSAGRGAAAAPVAFGAWRSADGGDVRLQKRIRSTDVVRHCVIREARTPPELSPEVLLRSLPPRPQPPAVQQLLTYLQSRSFRAATKPVQFDRLQESASAALQSLTYSLEMQRAVALYTVHALSCHRDWQTTSRFVLWLQGHWAASLVDVSQAQRRSDASHLAALLLDTVRAASPLNPSLLPTLDELDGFCDDFQRLLRDVTIDPAEERTKRRPLWDSVVCAPLLSVAGLKEQREAPPLLLNAVERVERLAERYCVQREMPHTYRHPKRQPQPLAYMPAVAWGEYLRALHRCGADLATLQSATDRITDPSITQQASQLLSSTHVWNAYLASSPGPHAAEVYAKNLAHYKVRATPATTAAVITALLSEGTTEARRQARVLWDRLRAAPPSVNMVRGTSSTVVAHAGLLVAEGDVAAVAALLTSFEHLYECFGVSLEWYEQQQQQQQRLREDGAARVTLADGLRLLRRACAAHPLLLPPVVQVALVEAARTVTEAATAAPDQQQHGGQEAFSSSSAAAAALSEEKEVMPELTAEDLAAML